MGEQVEPTLIIDPGHGGKDNGGGSNDSFKEKEMNLQISLYQYQRFQKLGVPISITREKDIYLSPTARTDKVKESGANYCISNHINAYKPEARGVETIHSIFSDDTLAKKLYDAIVAEGMPGRRVFSKKGDNGKDYYYMHRETGSVETIIIEYGFATNKEDTQLLANHWKDYAEAVVKAFCEYIKHPYTPPQKEAPQVEQKTSPYPENTPQWKKDHVDWLYQQKLLTDDNWKSKIDEPVPLWALAIMLQRMNKS